jgi:hypothetical protein
VRRVFYQISGIKKLKGHFLPILILFHLRLLIALHPAFFFIVIPPAPRE